MTGDVPRRCRGGAYAAVIVLSVGGLLAVAAERVPDHVFDDGVEVHFLTAAEAADAIVDDREQPFFSRLTLVEMAVRRGRALETRDLVTEQRGFKTFVRTCVLNWTRAEKDALLPVLRAVHTKCKPVVPDLIPRQWRFIKTDGREEGGAAYTRGDAIVLPARRLARGVATRSVVHETFHVYSRLHLVKREALYDSVGFRRLAGVTLPPALDAKRMTNPDGPDFNYAITIKDAEGRAFDAILLAYAKHEFKPEVTGLFSYGTFSLFEVRRRGRSWVLATDAAGQPTPIPVDQARGFYEQIGRNTGYVLHPDEILADNVALLVRVRSGEKASVKSPHILSKIERILRAN